MSRLDDLRQNVGLYKCERCGFTFKVDELIEEDKTGLIVDRKCLDQPSFLDQKQDSPRDNVEHHFDT